MSNFKIKMEDSVADFIKSYSRMRVADKEDEEKEISLYWIPTFFMETKDPTVFEVVETDNLLYDLLKTRLDNPNEEDNTEEY
jgi:hypothetical protein